MATTILVAALAFGVLFAAMAVGVIFCNRPIHSDSRARTDAYSDIPDVRAPCAPAHSWSARGLVAHLLTAQALRPSSTS